jgi:hypothetical protein
MADQDETGSESARHQVPAARPATPSDEAGRPEGWRSMSSLALT